ncbi:MAG: hypothetical protein GIKADHBN_02274 [Phycisphaerales bacterium]|nr:hypothetical protein [Phycisphaerales bacterium]
MPGPAIVLAIETSNPSAWELSVPVRPGVAVVEMARPGTHATPAIATAPSRVLAVEEIDPSRPHDDDLVPAIHRAVRAAGLTPAGLNRIAVSSGPGGFTAVRMAVTAAKTIADVVGIDLVLVPSATSAAAAAVGLGRTPRAVHEPFLVAIASKDQTAWAAEFDEHGTPAGQPRLISAADLGGCSCRVLIADRFLPDSVREAARSGGWRVIVPVFDAVACAAASAWFGATDPLAAVPLYPRPPEAVRKWDEVQARKALGEPPG